VESSNRHGWLEKLIEQLNKKGISQTLVTLESDGEINAYLSSKYPKLQLVHNHKKRLNLATGVVAILGVRKKNSLNLVFALGHPAAFIGAVTTIFPGMRLIFSHMQQPNFFKLMKPRWRGVIHNLVYNLYIARATLIHSLSGEVSEFLAKKGVKQDKIFKVNIGVNFEGIREKLVTEDQSIAIPPGSPRLLMVGRLAPEKNYELAFKTFAIFLEDNPDALLLVAGVGPQETKLKKLARELNLCKHIVFLGYVGNIPWLMTRVDVLLHLATTESYGQIYMEAILSNLSVVCSRTGVAIDLHEDNTLGVFIVNELSDEGILDKLNLCLKLKKTSTNANTDPFNTFKNHDEKFVYEKIADSFQSFVDIDNETY
jgi:glycosyltransferase involved in cell wall biosynthesis